jgi:hypothetical protein
MGTAGGCGSGFAAGPFFCVEANSFERLREVQVRKAPGQAHPGQLHRMPGSARSERKGMNADLERETRIYNG